MSDGPSPILMCPPTYFGVQYVINPWMAGNVGVADQHKAQCQWDTLHAMLSRHTTVEIVNPLPQLPDMCFVANAGLVLEDVFVPSVFRVPQRVPEVVGYTQWFADRQYKIESLPDGRDFEGEGDALFQPDADGIPKLWAGYGVRSSLLAHRHLTEFFRCDVRSVRLVDERFYHLDTCFAPLTGRRAMYYPAAFDARSLRLIRDHFSPDQRLEVSDEDALGFCCNAVRVDHHLVMNHASDDLKRRLADWGFETQVCPLSEFLLAGGAAKCLSLILKQATADGLHHRPVPESSIRTARIELSGHLLDSGVMNRVLDTVTDAGGSFRIEQFSAGLRHDQPSLGRLRLSAPDQDTLDSVLNDLQPLGAMTLGPSVDATLEPAPADGVAPEHFYSTTIYPTEVRVAGRWQRVCGQRMDVVIVIDTASTARCVLMRDLKKEIAWFAASKASQSTRPNVPA